MINGHNYTQRVGYLGSKYGARFLYKYLKNISEDKCEEIFKIAIRSEKLVKELVEALPRQTKGTFLAGLETYGIEVGMFLAQFLPNAFDLRDSVNDKYDKSVEEEVYYAFGKCFQITDEEVYFYDIYWTLDDLSEQEKANYQRCIDETADAIKRKDNDPSRFAALYFCCPNCQQMIRNDEISTASHSFLCSNCNKNFLPKEAKLLRGIYKSQKEVDKGCLIF